MIDIEFIYGSYYVYTPKPNSDSAKIAKDKVLEIKNDKIVGDKPRSLDFAQIMKENSNRLPFKSFFGSGSYLVSVPKSSLMVKGALWVPDRIALALSLQKLGIYFPCLEREKPVKKAAFSKPEERPKVVDHVNSLKVNSRLVTEKMERIVLIDDVITSGATLVGCALRLKEKFPNIPIFCFAEVRTLNNPSEFKKFEDPCLGKITYYPSGKTHRDP